MEKLVRLADAETPFGVMTGNGVLRSATPQEIDAFIDSQIARCRAEKAGKKSVVRTMAGKKAVVKAGKKPLGALRAIIDKMKFDNETMNL